MLVSPTDIPVRLTGPPYIMHHKFVLIDSSLVLQGSMNWTTQACSGNYENVVITGTPGIVSAFRDHFDTLYTRLSEERQKLIKESEKISEKLSEKESWDWVTFLMVSVFYLLLQIMRKIFFFLKG